MTAECQRGPSRSREFESGQRDTGKQRVELVLKSGRARAQAVDYVGKIQKIRKRAAARFSVSALSGDLGIEKIR